MNKDLFKKCWEIVDVTGSSVLIVKNWDTFYVYFVGSGNFIPKSMHNNYNEANEVVDITDILPTIDNFGTLTDQIVQDKTQNLPVLSFRFGHGDFVWLTNKRNKTFV